jgi:hypothetical protein
MQTWMDIGHQHIFSIFGHVEVLAV